MVVYCGFEEVCCELGWMLSIVNGWGDLVMIWCFFDEVLRVGVDVIVLGGFDEVDIVDWLVVFVGCVLVLVGWYVLFNGGCGFSLFVNVSSDLFVVVDMVVVLVMLFSGVYVGVVIFNDVCFDIVNIKMLCMCEVLLYCVCCELLVVEDILILGVVCEVLVVLVRLQQQFGVCWIYVLVINDVYMDLMYFLLLVLGCYDIVGIVVGDGLCMVLSCICLGCL